MEIWGAILRLRAAAWGSVVGLCAVQWFADLVCKIWQSASGAEVREGRAQQTTALSPRVERGAGWERKEGLLLTAVFWCPFTQGRQEEESTNPKLHIW
jgi:hypothetical protein